MSVKNIVNDPGKSDLQTAFFNPQLGLHLVFTAHHRANPQHSRIKTNIKIHFKITKLEVESGSGNSFNLWGYDSRSGKHWTGNYSTKTRKGWIKEENKKKFDIISKF